MNKKCCICGEKDSRISFYFRKNNVEFAIYEPTCDDKECLREYSILIQESLDNYEETNKNLLCEEIEYGKQQ